MHAYVQCGPQKGDLWWLRTDGVNGCALTAYECTYANQVTEQCLSTVSDAETQLADLHEDDVKMEKDKFSWASAPTTPTTPHRISPGLPTEPEASPVDSVHRRRDR